MAGVAKQGGVFYLKVLCQDASQTENFDVPVHRSQ